LPSRAVDTTDEKGFLLLDDVGQRLGNLCPLNDGQSHDRPSQSRPLFLVVVSSESFLESGGRFFFLLLTGQFQAGHRQGGTAIRSGSGVELRHQR